MSRPLVRIHNAETDEVIDREMNDVEFAEWEAGEAIKAAKIAEQEAQAAAKAALLERLGITEEEARLLLG